MKYSTLSQKRKDAVDQDSHLAVDNNDNIIFDLTREILPDENLHCYFMWKNI